MFSLIIGLLALAAGTSAVAIPRRDNTTCSYPTFNLHLGDSSAFSQKAYATMEDAKISFSTDDAASATVFTIDSSTGYLYSSPQQIGWWAGNTTASASSVYFGTAAEMKAGAHAAKIKVNAYAARIHCSIDAASSILVCAPEIVGDGNTTAIVDTTTEAWTTCDKFYTWLGLVHGSAMGPYITLPGVASIINIKCGTVQVTAVNQGCASSSPV